MNIHVETIAHVAQRYSTTGDWWWEKETLQLRVSRLKDWRYSMLVAFHELIEALLCKANGITQEQADAWDMGSGAEADEPGDDPRAPYHREHRAAALLERRFARELGVDWKAYLPPLDPPHVTALIDAGHFSCPLSAVDVGRVWCTAVRNIADV